MANRVEASETTEREIDIAVREIVVKPFHRATEMLRAPRANLAEGARLLLAQETGDRRSIPCDPLDRCEGSAGRTH
jgi:ATP-dependent Zn protease